MGRDQQAVSGHTQAWVPNYRVRGGSYLSICKGVAACNVSSISQVKPLIHMFTSSSDVARSEEKTAELRVHTSC